jgi:hypothetical protein
MLRLSVIIPTLNEATNLPGLLDALSGQTRPPDEIIVADAGSVDGTAELAQQRGARVVHGGMPAVGRNAGARAAAGDVFLFFDADVLPPADFVERTLDEFTREGYVVATCPSATLDGDPADEIIIQAANLYLQVVQPISPHAPGYCILARREIHQAIGGFDESLKMSEDHDYVRRASQYGAFGVLTGARIPVSMRRLDKEGLPQLALKYLWCEMYALAGKPVRSMPFEYEFGAYRPAEPTAGRFLIDIADLRAQLGRFENPIQRLSRSGLDQLRRLVELDPVDTTRGRLRLLLERPDLDMLDRYLQQRLALIPRGHKPLQEAWSKLKTLPGESIRLLEPDWLRSRLSNGTSPEAEGHDE